MIGRTGVVKQACAPEGTVKIGSTLWKAVSLDGSELAEGLRIVVRDIEGLEVIVEEAPESPGEGGGKSPPG